MFLSQVQITNAVKRLENVHPFFGISFLVFKESDLPVGKTTSISINRDEDSFLQVYYRPQLNSSWFYRVFRVSDKNQFWLKPDYASSGSQSIRTRTFGEAFLHASGSDEWGWQTNYVASLRSKLYKNQKISAYSLAIWLYRDHSWPSESSASSIFNKFRQQFKLTSEELDQLFDISEPEDSFDNSAFSEHKFSWMALTEQLNIPPPPDVPQEEGGTLSLLELEGVGPAKKLHLDFSERTNLLTGDNGLGKSFILEGAWWALSGNWAGFQALPREDAGKNEPRISFQIAGSSGKRSLAESRYDWEAQQWTHPRKRPTIPGLLIYAKVDGAFAVWDPARSYRGLSSSSTTSEIEPITFAREDIWNGLSSKAGGRTTYVSNGLISDWVSWQNSPDGGAFKVLKKVLLRLSPPSLELGDLGPLKPGKPQKVPGDSRWIPTIKHSYGEIPIVYASAGVRRIVALAYLIVWAWEEHKTQSEHIRKDPQKRMVILIDEIEAHLHPQWQRTILPALFEVWKDLNSDIQIQMIIATHSPLVMASMEPSFDIKKDKIFHIDLVQKDLIGTEVIIKNPDFIVYGTVDSWLKSDIFELGQARSIEAEKAIEDAKALQGRNVVSAQEVDEVSRRLIQYLSAHDEFWPRWTFFASQNGVTL
jgi:hypothetical protein